MSYKNIDELAKQVGGSLRLTQLIISRARQIIKKRLCLWRQTLMTPSRLPFRVNAKEDQTK